MSSTDKKQTFELAGRFLGFAGKNPKRPKYVRLSTAHGEQQVKLRQKLRQSLPSSLTPGEWIQITGQQKIKPSGQVKRKARQVIHTSPKTVPTEGVAAVQARLPQPKAKSPQASILVCRKSKCCKRGGRELCAALESTLRDRGLEDQVTIKGTGCMKRCKEGPNLIVMPDKTRYSRISAKKVADLVEHHFPEAQATNHSAG